jgi:hypothetical protein
MNALLNGLRQEGNKAKTANGADTNASSLDACLDFFYLGPVCKAKPKDAVKAFQLAYAQDREVALRVLQWVRDVRGGAGARQAFRDCFAWLMDRNSHDAIAILNKTALIGRWDDVLVGLFSQHITVQKHAIELIRNALLEEKNGLCAKWMPRKGPIALALRTQLRLAPKAYRKLLVNLSTTVETQMCANEWDEVNYSHVPSVAFARYRKAFKRHDGERYADFVDAANRGEAKINASAIFPHDVVKLIRGRYAFDLPTRQSISAQWKSLPNYMEGDNTGLVVADVSGSMSSVTAGSSTALDICIALAMYMSERARGPFKDTFITFSDTPKLQHLKGDIIDRYQQLQTAEWGFSTNIEAVFSLLLNTAMKNDVPPSDMPSMITIISDMEFNACTKGTALNTIRARYKKAGYELPKVVFWNVNGRANNVPATANDKDVGLISGYSPAILGTLFNTKRFDPISLMLEAVMVPRYNLA